MNHHHDAAAEAAAAYRAEREREAARDRLVRGARRPAHAERRRADRARRSEPPDHGEGGTHAPAV
ncbi:hypothetical protein ACIRPH_14525 [Nocardiopsis sp. NPDC101807]|uniref:hypothetical protein n=1 Tax=Nocardiopsis sp. NPDC101807 TaxID=3364339 RepID=UPI003820B4FC